MLSPLLLLSPILLLLVVVLVVVLVAIESMSADNLNLEHASRGGNERHLAQGGGEG